MDSDNANSNAYAPTATITFIIRPPPPFPAPPRSVDLSALEFILGLIGVISIPALIYTFFFAIKCSPRRHSSGGEGSRRSSSSSSASAASSSDRAEVTSDMKYNKETHGAECPVCLSAFAEGGEVKVLSACNHAFHTSCIDKWLNSQSNCPVCRAPVAGKRPNTTHNSRSYAAPGTDMHQGLPDASHLV